ncbi:MAG: hypothetical protein U0470_07420 [Anaerolineae bacterium]
MGAGATVEDVRIADDDGAAVGIAIDGAGRHTVRGVMFDQLAVGVAGGCLDGPTCVANLDVRRALFLNCEAAGIDADERTLLTADHLSFRTLPLGARITRPRSRLTNSVFDLEEGDVGIDQRAARRRTERGRRAPQRVRPARHALRRLGCSGRR